MRGRRGGRGKWAEERNTLTKERERGEVDEGKERGRRKRLRKGPEKREDEEGERGSKEKNTYRHINGKTGKQGYEKK